MDVNGGEKWIRMRGCAHLGKFQIFHVRFKKEGNNKMKKLSVTIVIILAMITVLGSICGASDKTGYVIGSLFEIPDNYNNLPT